MRNFRLLVTFALAATLLTARDGKWISLIQQSTLDGWQTEGNAAWSVDKGTMVGRQGPGGSAGDIFTKQRWTDFELEAEWKNPTIDPSAPVILEQPNPPGPAIHVYVVWPAWQQLDRVTRGEVIMDAAERVKPLDEYLRITQAWGLTPDEADRLKIAWRA